VRLRWESSSVDDLMVVSHATADILGGAAVLLGMEGVSAPVDVPVVIEATEASDGHWSVALPHGPVEMVSANGSEAARIVHHWLVSRDHGVPDPPLLLRFHAVPPEGSGLEMEEAIHDFLGERFDHLPPGLTPHPLGAHLVAIDTGYPAPHHAALPEQVAVAAHMAYRLALEFLGLEVRDIRRGHVAIIDDPWEGKPYRLPPSLWDGALRHRVPESMFGDAFGQVYTGIVDPSFRIDRGTSYPLRAALTFATGEFFRARLWRTLATAATSRDDYQLLGEILFQSHAAAERCGLSPEPANVLVNLALQQGEEWGIQGARLSGYGGGGSVIVLARDRDAAGIEALCDAYREETGLTPTLYPCHR
jgi:hypothetical protein